MLLLFAVENYNTAKVGRSRWGKSIPVRLRIPSSVKETIRSVAKERGTTASQLIRLALFSRFHINIHQNNSNEAAKDRITFRLSYGNWLALKAYSLAWGFPIWKAFLILLTHPYTVHDRPQKSHVLQMSYEYPSDKKEKNNYVCTHGGLSKANEQIKPTNNLAFRLWNDYGMSLLVANDIVKNFPSNEIEAAIELRERRNGTVFNPAGFIIYLLKNGYAQRYLQHKIRKIDPDLRAEEVKKALRERGVEIVDYGGVEYRIVDREGRLWRPIDPADLESTLRLARELGLIDCASKADNDPETEKLTDACKAALETDNKWWNDFENDGDIEQAPSSAMIETKESEGEDDEEDSEPFEPTEFVCQRCGRGEGETHPSLPSYAKNNLFPISEQNLKVRQVLGLGESGLVCRGCIIEAYRAILADEVKGHDA
jgi:hypothetical protein